MDMTLAQKARKAHEWTLRDPKCDCCAVDIGVGLMHEPWCEAKVGKCQYCERMGELLAECADELDGLRATVERLEALAAGGEG